MAARIGVCVCVFVLYPFVGGDGLKGELKEEPAFWGPIPKDMSRL